MKVHMVTYGRHWVSQIAKVICPSCKASPGFDCIEVARDHGTPAVRMSPNTVHASRVKAAGNNVYIGVGNGLS